MKDAKKKGEMTVSGGVPVGGHGSALRGLFCNHVLLSRQRKGPSLKSLRRRCLLSGWPRGIAEPRGPEQCLRRSQQEALVGRWGGGPTGAGRNVLPETWASGLGESWRDNKSPYFLSNVCTSMYSYFWVPKW